MSDFRFVGYPSAVLIDDNGEAVMERLWGSYLNLTGQKSDGLLQVKMGADLYWIDEKDTQPDGLLEIVFVDIGQGDGCLLSIPKAGKTCGKLLHAEVGRQERRQAQKRPKMKSRNAP